MTEKFTATFTLSQEGPDGPVMSELSFNPLVDRANIDNAPTAYEMMAYLAQTYLFMTNVIDEEGNLLDPDAFDTQTTVNVSTLGDKSRLN
jgi:hypothetical protein